MLTSSSWWRHVASILVPRAHDPSGLWQGSRALAWSKTGSPRFTDFPSNLIGREYETNALRILRKSVPARAHSRPQSPRSMNCGLPVLDKARALDSCHRPEGSWALGTRMVGCNLRTCAVPHFWGNLLPAAVSAPAVAICLNSLIIDHRGRQTVVRTSVTH